MCRREGTCHEPSASGISAAACSSHGSRRAASYGGMRRRPCLESARMPSSSWICRSTRSPPVRSETYR